MEMNLNNFESDLAAKKRLNIIFAVIGAVGLIGGIPAFTLQPVLGVLIVAAGIAGIVLSVKTAKAIKNLTVPIRRSVLEEYLQLQSYEPDRHFEKDMVKQTKLFSGWSSISGSDLVEGKYRNVPLRFCDLKLTHQESSGKHTRTVTDFSGTFLEIGCDRSLQGELRIREKTWGSFTLFGRSRIVEMENEAFNKQFEVMADSAQEAFYVLTPHFMETLVHADAYADSRTQILFRGNQIIVGLYNSKDLFEGKGEKTMEGYRQSCIRDLAYVTDFLDILFENTALFDHERTSG